MSPREDRAGKTRDTSRRTARGRAAKRGNDAGAAPAQVLPMGERALLLELPTLEDALAWNDSVRTAPLPGQEWSVVAARTVLVRFETSADALAAADEISARTPGAGKASTGRTRRIGVVYDGEDLEEVARATGLSAEAVVAAHTGTPWTAAFGGFAPGFVYLTGGDERLVVPRRDSPRTRVPAGAVALAGEFSAVYPKASPGGWQLIGRTDAVLFDPDAKDPALIRPGDTVRFEARRESARVMRRGGATTDEAAAGGAVSSDGATSGDVATAGDASSAARPFPEVAAGASALEILAPGPRTLVEDSGRPGLGDLGVTGSGAADGPSARQANRLVGNAPDAAVLETLLGGLRVRARGDLVLALTGAIGEGVIHRADADTAQEDDNDLDEGDEAAPRGDAGFPVALCEPFGLRDGETLALAAPTSGLRGYLAVRGGIDVPAQLGSRAADTLSGLGPRPLAAGDVLAIGQADAHRSVGTPEEPAAVIPQSPQDPEAPQSPQGPDLDEDAGDGGSTAPVLRIRRGPRADWAEDDALLGRTWVVGGDSDRVGARLEAADGDAPLRRVRTEELASEGLVPGAVQLPPSGLPVVFLADHPVTGGYPVIAVVDEADLPLLAQLRPGTRLRFAPSAR
ncbi:urea amidolyase family protein [Brachybacterium halotolerans subsp. kimchii]|uniref:5-oxoprolinase subunit B/C family protein n=1 Tax=Brachybacterium halotolerans TaxID=2795215 RepID=UPI001E621220|nr:urea amidolyase family protein [Brachybacterium halotolerans]UEJ81171.1 urea amidolyase family protein [Brachybacterium halotolerans subsp. kimchii]